MSAAVSPTRDWQSIVLVTALATICNSTSIPERALIANLHCRCRRKEFMIEHFTLINQHCVASLFFEVSLSETSASTIFDRHCCSKWSCSTASSPCPVITLTSHISNLIDMDVSSSKVSRQSWLNASRCSSSTISFCASWARSSNSCNWNRPSMRNFTALDKVRWLDWFPSSITIMLSASSTTCFHADASASKYNPSKLYGIVLVSMGWILYITIFFQLHFSAI